MKKRILGRGEEDTQACLPTNSPSSTSQIRVTVDYGYDVHRINISKATFAKIQAGLPVFVEGQGFLVEGVMEQDEWSFNYGPVGAVSVSTDTCRDVFEGNLGDAEVTVYGPRLDGAEARNPNEIKERREGDTSR